mmetsp:Transcript_9178/g.21658  ORF Transcript_9178/g.21658 Transcript_9178/m.21658 type:complete len:251 (+) Transcript_9178:428-1180(+)
MTRSRRGSRWTTTRPASPAAHTTRPRPVWTTRLGVCWMPWMSRAWRTTRPSSSIRTTVGSSASARVGARIRTGRTESVCRSWWQYLGCHKPRGPVPTTSPSWWTSCPLSPSLPASLPPPLSSVTGLIRSRVYLSCQPSTVARSSKRPRSHSTLASRKTSTCHGRTTASTTPIPPSSSTWATRCVWTNGGILSGTPGTVRHSRRTGLQSTPASSTTGGGRITPTWTMTSSRTRTWRIRGVARWCCSSSRRY